MTAQNEIELALRAAKVAQLILKMVGVKDMMTARLIHNATMEELENMQHAMDKMNRENVRP